ncbi:MAG: phytoene desaturase family protein [Paracoccaceae bacterium]|nr:phytoene desaturase family protein [Paracoccaceae bacterium]
MSRDRLHTIVVGAGFGGLATAIRLAAAGDAVTVVEAAGGPGGKARTVPSAAGPVDAGPTVLTMRWVFDDLARAAGTRLDDHVTLHPEPVIARHWWPDGSRLDLFAGPEASADAIAAFAGVGEADRFRAFRAETETLFEAFRTPMMETGSPRLAALAGAAIANPALLPALMPWATMARRLAGQFRDRRLRQLFGRYATYVGGSPYASPALLSLIWRAEEHGVWRVGGGMHRLAAALASIAEGLGVSFCYETRATRIERQGGRVAALSTDRGERIAADAVVFAGDPRALRRGLLGQGVAASVPERAVEPRSLSARVWSFAAVVEGPELLHHNVFFGADPRSEFDPVAAGTPPEDPTLYICAEDRGAGQTPPRLERFEIIENAAPVGGRNEEAAQCRTRVFQTLARRGVSFEPTPDLGALTDPDGFEALFPGSAGSLYGRSPHGALAALARPRAKTPVPGLYLAGGGTHPGAGVPMATLSGKHAAETIMSDRTSTSASRRTAMPGGISTGSPTMGPARSRSSPS